MYPSIPKDLGMRKCREYLDQREDDGLCTECVLEAVDITLENNITEFNGTWYRQAHGAGMGPHNSGDWSDISMSEFDEIVMSDLSPYKLLLWCRFKDDVYEPWMHGLDALEIFTAWLNSINPHIQFTCKVAVEGVEFLDTYVYTSEGKLQTRVHSKESDTHTYLLPTSCHALHICKNIPHGIAQRIYKISSEEIPYQRSRVEYTEHLCKRGYNKELVLQAFSNVEERDRLEYLKPSNKAEKVCNPLVIDYNPALPDVPSIVNKYKYIVDLDPIMSKHIPSSSIIVSFKRAKNLKDILTHSKFVDDNEHIDSRGCFKCKNKCDMCNNYLVETQRFKSFQSNKTYTIRPNLTCNAVGTIYLINDKICSKSYVGSSITTCKTRFSNHKSHIKSYYLDCELAQHFKEFDETHKLDRTNTISFNECLKTQLEIIIIDQVSFESNDSKIEKMRKCKIKEGFWISQLRTLKKFGGLNIKDERKAQYHNAYSKRWN